MDEGGIPPFVIGDGDGLEVISVVDIFKFIMKWFTKLTSSHNVFQRGFLRNLPVGVGDGALERDPGGIVGFDVVGGYLWVWSKINWFHSYMDNLYLLQCNNTTSFLHLHAVENHNVA